MALMTGGDMVLDILCKCWPPETVQDGAKG